MRSLTHHVRVYGKVPQGTSDEVLWDWLCDVDMGHRVAYNLDEATGDISIRFAHRKDMILFVKCWIH